MNSRIIKSSHVAANALKGLMPKESLSTEEMAKKIFEECQNSAQLLKDNLTEAEQCRVAFVPLVITNIAWRYADLVLEEVATLKVECLKKLARSMRDLHRKYDADIMLALDYTRRKQIETETDKCLNEINLDMTKLFFSVNHEFKRTSPDYPYDRMRSHAVMGKLLIDYLIQYNKRSDEMIAQRLGYKIAPSQVPIVVENLGICFEAFAGVGKEFNWQAPYIQTAVSVIDNKIKSAEFNILNDEERAYMEERMTQAAELKKKAEQEIQQQQQTTKKQKRKCPSSSIPENKTAEPKQKVVLNIPCQSSFIEEMETKNRREMQYDATPYWCKRLLKTKQAYTHVVFYSGNKRSEYKFISTEEANNKITIIFN